MTQEQEKALKVCEKLVNCMTDHTLSAEDIMILIQGILSNDCGNSCYTPTPIYIPQRQETTPSIRPGDVWCGDNPKICLYSNEGTTTLEELPNHFKNENEMIEEVRKTLEKNGDPIKDEYATSICAGDNVPNIQYVVR